MILEEIKEKIGSAKNILVVGHISPDPDAIGATCAMADIIENNFDGKNVYIFFEDKIPDNLKFILNGKEVFNYFPKDKNIDLIIYLDLSELKRAGKILSEGVDKNIFSICIDHHESNDNFANINYVEKTASATCEILYKIFTKLNFKISKNAASALFAGLSADSGSFRFSSTTEYTFSVAGDLTKLGADIYTISTNIWSSKSKKTISLLGTMLSRMELLCDDKFAISYLTQEDLEKIDADKSHVSGLIGYMRDIEGVVLAVLLYEEDGNYKISARSKDTNISTLPITESFGGGGHFMASGARFSKDTATKEEVLEKIKGIGRESVFK